MAIDSMIGQLSAKIPLSVAYQQALQEAAVTEYYRPGQIMLAEGQIENRLWFIESGFVRSYYYDHRGRDHTLSFFSANDFIFSYQGYWKEASDHYLETLLPSTLLSLTYDRLKEHLVQYPEAQTLKDIFVHYYDQQERFRKRLMTWTAAERYLQIRKLQPELFRKASVKLIASYLNMSRENLSRLMSKDY